jgi:hypothetical protein
MSKRIRSSRMAKKGRRLRPSGERASNPGVRDSLTSAPDAEEARDSGEVLSSRPASTANGTSHGPNAHGPTNGAAANGNASAAPVAIARVVPVGEPPAPAAEDAELVVPASTPTPPPVATSSAVTVPMPMTVKAVAAEAAKSGGKKAKKGAEAKVLREPDARVDSGALSLNDAVTRSFYESLPAGHDQVEAHEDEVEVARPVAMTPELLERKAKLRRIVGGICAAAALVVVLVAGKTLLDRGSAQTPTASNTAVTLDASPQSAPAERPKVEAPPPKAAEPAPAPKPAAAAPSEAEKKGEEDKKAADDKAAEEKKAEEEKKAAEGAPKSKEELAELKKKASSLYNHGKLKEAIPALREAIAADPDDALPYLYLGDALTNTGKWPEAREAYNECVRNAKKGPKYECAAMGGRK